MAEAHPGAERRSAPPPRPARPPRPRSRAARPRASSSVTSPTGSAAASQQQPPRVGAAATRSAARKLCSMRPDQRHRGPGSPNPPASSAGVRPRGSSSSASGLPRVSADDPVPDPLVEQPRQRGVEQRARVAVREPFDDQLRQPRRARPRGWARGRRTPSRSAPRAGAAPRTPASARTRDRATARRRRRTPADAPRPPRPAGSAPPGRRGSGPGRRRSCSPNGDPQRVPLRAGQAVEPVEHAARTADAGRRTGAPSRTRRPPPARCDTPPRARRRTRAARSCRSPPRRAGPAPGSDRPARLAAADPATRTRCAGRAVRARHRDAPLPTPSLEDRSGVPQTR